MELLLILISIFSFITALGIWSVFWMRKAGFIVLDAHIVKTKNNLPVLSLTISFKGTPVSYLNPMIYIKSGSALYKAAIFSGSSIPENRERIIVRETPDEIKFDKILPHRLGIFTINVFYPTEFSHKNKTYLYVIKKNSKVKKIPLKYKIK